MKPVKNSRRVQYYVLNPFSHNRGFMLMSVSTWYVSHPRFVIAIELGAAL